MVLRLWAFIFLALSGCTNAHDRDALASLKTTLASHASATAALERWCAVRRIADPARISARQVRDADLPAQASLRSNLGVQPDAEVAYRHVRLSCGDAVLSQAHNWYLPDRLTAQMNQQLAETDIPFGRVVASLNFRRFPLKTGRTDHACPADTVLANRAVLRLPDGQALALVIECYTAATLSDTVGPPEAERVRLQAPR